MMQDALNEHVGRRGKIWDDKALAMISDVMHDEILKTLVSRPKTSHIVLQFHTAKYEHNLYVDNPCMVCVLVTRMMYVLPKHYLVNMPCLAGYETPRLNPPV